jgi:hypothetical protein
MEAVMTVIDPLTVPEMVPVTVDDKVAAALTVPVMDEVMVGEVVTGAVAVAVSLGVGEVVTDPEREIETVTEAETDMVID